jgi:hypothetical protein
MLLMIKKEFGVAIIILSTFVSMTTSAHQHFFSLSELSINQQTAQLEVIHYLSAHDLENAIATEQNIEFSPEHQHYELLIKNYIEEHFKLYKNSKQSVLNWIGLELNKEQVIIYQENKKHHFLTGIMVKNNILVNNYPAQINIVNYQDNKSKGSLKFSNSQAIMLIK